MLHEDPRQSRRKTRVSSVLSKSRFQSHAWLPHLANVTHVLWLIIIPRAVRQFPPFALITKSKSSSPPLQPQLRLHLHLSFYPSLNFSTSLPSTSFSFSIVLPSVTCPSSWATRVNTKNSFSFIDTLFASLFPRHRLSQPRSLCALFSPSQSPALSFKPPSNILWFCDNTTRVGLHSRQRKFGCGSFSAYYCCWSGKNYWRSLLASLSYFFLCRTISYTCRQHICFAFVPDSSGLYSLPVPWIQPLRTVPPLIIDRLGFLWP